MCSLATEGMHLNEHEAARWLDKKSIYSLKWLPADEDILPLIVEELDNHSSRSSSDSPTMMTR